MPMMRFGWRIGLRYKGETEESWQMRGVNVRTQTLTPLNGLSLASSFYLILLFYDLRSYLSFFYHLFLCFQL